MDEIMQNTPKPKEPPYARNFEVCVDHIESAIEAIDGGAIRLEVCSALELGGLTPTAGLVKAIRMYADRRRRFVHVSALIRCRPGDFIYSFNEIAQMTYEIRGLVDLVDGFVFGCLKDDGSVDKDMCRRLIQHCTDREMVFHRAFDLCKQPLVQLETIIELGFNRLLTSGQKATVQEGIPLIQELTKTANGRIVIMPGGGIDHYNIGAIHEQLNLVEYHGSASERCYSPASYMNESIPLSKPVPSNYHYRRTSSEIVRQIIKKLNPAREVLLTGSLKKNRNQTH